MLAELVTIRDNWSFPDSQTQEKKELLVSPYFRHAPAEDELLPTPPGSRERRMYVDRHMWVLISVSIVSFSCITWSQFKFSISHPVLFVFLPLTAFTILYYVFSLLVNIGPRDFNYTDHLKFVDKSNWLRWLETNRKPIPSVDVFLPISGEDFVLIANTWRFVRALDYPGRLMVYVLNDGPDGAEEERLRDLALSFGFTYLRRPAEGNTLNTRGTYKKAGNLQHGFHRSSGDYIMVFDADFVPSSLMLLNLVPYFELNPRLGIVQSPQYFRTRSQHMNWLERGAGVVQEWFYRISQTSRNHWKAAICVGTCAMYRRKALAENGGPTLIGHSEDVHTGFDLRILGWELEYIPVALSTGVCPSVRSSYLAQQYRWFSGSMSMLLSRKFWEFKMPFRARAGYLSGFCYYLHTAALTFVAPAIPLTLLALYPEMIRLQNYVLIVPSLVYTLVVLPLWHRTRYGLSALAAKMVYGWAHVFALVDLVRGTQKGWQTTGNTSSTRGMLDKHFFRGTIGWGCTTALAWVGLAIWRAVMAPGNGWVNFMPILASGLLYAVVVGKTLSKTEPTHLPELDDLPIMESRSER